MATAIGGIVPDGYIEREYVATGEATDYTVAGGMTADGLWTLEPGRTASYRTRVLVRAPQDPCDASGTVVIEWLNVSSGSDTNPFHANVSDEIIRNGDVWIGVSAQVTGVEGGEALVDDFANVLSSVGKGLKRIDEERYGSLEHPGDGFSYDIFTQVTRAARQGGEFIGDVNPQVVLAAGQSQSATALVTYYNGVQPLARVFDGFLVHSRASVALSIPEPGEAASLAAVRATNPPPVLMRGDLDAPVLELEAESDLFGTVDSHLVRQEDTPTFRLWEVAGTAHVDTNVLSVMANNVESICHVAPNSGPMRFVARAALRALDRWVRTGDAPASAELIAVTGTGPGEIVRDEDGIAVGGVRTPIVDAPVEVVSGAGGESDRYICELAGSTRPMAPGRIAARYPDVATYEAQFAESTDAAIADGFVLEADREAIMALMQPDLVGV